MERCVIIDKKREGTDIKEQKCVKDKRFVTLADVRRRGSRQQVWVDFSKDN